MSAVEPQVILGVRSIARRFLEDTDMGIGNLCNLRRWSLQNTDMGIRDFRDL